MIGNAVELCLYLALDIFDPRFERHYVGNVAKWCRLLVHFVLHAYYGIWSVTWLKNVIIICFAGNAAFLVLCDSCNT